MPTSKRTAAIPAGVRVQPDGTLRNRRVFASTPSSTGDPKAFPDQRFGGDGITIDSEERLYATTAARHSSLQSAKANSWARFRFPETHRTSAFAGPDKKTLYITARGAILKIEMLTGIQGPAEVRSCRAHLAHLSPSAASPLPTPRCRPQSRSPAGTRDAQEACGDRRAVAARAVHEDRAIRRQFRQPFAEMIERHADAPADTFLLSLARARARRA
mgnify:CR=1 FL=1